MQSRRDRRIRQLYKAGKIRLFISMKKGPGLQPGPLILGSELPDLLDYDLSLIVILQGDDRMNIVGIIDRQ